MKDKLVTRLNTIVTNVSSRTYPNLAPQGTTAPFLVYSVPAKIRDYTMSGFSQFTKIWFLIKVYATTKTSAESTAAQVITAMDGWPATDSKINAVFVQSEKDGKEVDTSLYFVNQIVEIQHNY